ncbi:hypothetical protein WBG83_21275 [Paenibacillus sp. y28]
MAHDNESMLAEQIKNLRHYVPNAKITLYNGGTNPGFGQKHGIPICPYSRPLQYGKLGRYVWDMMTWLQETKADYKYFINLDSDVLFIKPGFEAFIDEMMEGFDCMGAHMQVQHSPQDNPQFYPGMTLWKEWPKWQPFFQTDYFARYFNPVQIYRHSMVERIVAETDRSRLEHLLQVTDTFAMEEMLYATLAMKYGGSCREYPWDYTESLQYVRTVQPITAQEMKAAKSQPHYYWIHPVKDEMLQILSMLSMQLDLKK